VHAKEVEAADHRRREDRERNGRAELKECGDANRRRMVDEVAKRRIGRAERDRWRSSAGQNRAKDEAAGEEHQEHDAWNG